MNGSYAVQRKSTQDAGESEHNRERPRHSTPTDPQAAISALQDAAGNSAVSQLFNPPPPSGQPLSTSHRQWLEQSAGPLPPIAIQDGAQAQEHLTNENANAAAQGNQILAAPKAFVGEAGKFLLAHEVAHVLQQNTPHLPAGSIQQVEADANSFARNATAGRTAAVQVSAGAGWAYEKKRIRKGDTVASMLVTLDPQRVLIRMASGDVFTYTWSLNNIPEGDHTAHVTGNKIQVEIKGETVLYFTGAPNPRELVFPKSFPLKVVAKGQGKIAPGTGTGGGEEPSQDKEERPAVTGGEKEGEKPGSSGATEEKGITGAPGAVQDVPKDAKVPVITITDVNQIEELKKRGIIPAESADKIKAKLEKQEQLTFEEAITLLDGLNQLVESGSTEEAKESRQSWLKWARLIEQHKGQISGKAKTGDKGITPEEVQEIIKKHNEYVGVKDAPARKTKDAVYDPERRKSWNNLQEWEKKLWEEYTAKYGDTADVTDSSSSDLRISSSVRFSMALRMSPQYMQPGAKEAAEQLFNDPIFIGGTIAGIGLYVAAWLAPEPLFSKAAAAAITAALLTVFSVSEIKNVAVAWMRLEDETKNVTTLAELEKAAENFGKAIGGVGLRVLVMIATLLVGKALPAPKAPPGGGGGLVPAPAGAPPGAGAGAIASEGAAIKVLADGTIVVIGPATGVAMSAGKGEGGGSKQPTDEPKSTQPKEESKPGTEQKDKPSQGTKAVPPWKGPVDYSSVPNPKNTGPGLKYTDPTHKARILEHNRKANGGLLRSDIDGTILDPPQRAVGGAPKNMNQAEIDHRLPRAEGGPNTSENARVISARQNADLLKKQGKLKP